MVLILTADALLAAWIGSSLDAPRSLLTGLAVWWVVQAAISPRFMVQNSAGIIGPQLLGWSAYLVLSIPVKWLGLHALGVVAVPVASAAIYVFTVVPSAVWGYRLALSRATAETALVPARADPVS